MGDWSQYEEQANDWTQYEEKPEPLPKLGVEPVASHAPTDFSAPQPAGKPLHVVFNEQGRKLTGRDSLEVTPPPVAPTVKIPAAGSRPIKFTPISVNTITGRPQPMSGPAHSEGDIDTEGLGISRALLEAGNQYIAQPVGATNEAINQSIRNLTGVHLEKDDGTLGAKVEVEAPKAFATPNVEAKPGATTSEKTLQFLAPAGRVVKDLTAIGTAPFSVALAPVAPAVQPLSEGLSDTAKLTTGEARLGPDNRYHMADPNLDELYDQIYGAVPYVAAGSILHGVSKGAPPTIERSVADTRAKLDVKLPPVANQDVVQFRSILKNVGIDLPENATLEQAQNAYRQAMKQVHTDVSGGNTTRAAQDLNIVWGKLKKDGIFTEEAPADAISAQQRIGQKLYDTWQQVKAKFARAPQQASEPQPAAAEAGNRGMLLGDGSVPAEPLPASVQTSIKAAQAEAQAKAIVNPAPVVPEAPQTEPVTGQSISKLTEAVRNAPVETRDQAIAQAHEAITQSLIEHGKAVVDGVVYTAATPSQASTVAAKIVNEAVKKADASLDSVPQTAPERVPTPQAPMSGREAKPIRGPAEFPDSELGGVVDQTIPEWAQYEEPTAAATPETVSAAPSETSEGQKPRFTAEEVEELQTEHASLYQQRNRIIREKNKAVFAGDTAKVERLEKALESKQRQLDEVSDLLTSEGHDPQIFEEDIPEGREGEFEDATRPAKSAEPTAEEFAAQFEEPEGMEFVDEASMSGQGSGTKHKSNEELARQQRKEEYFTIAKNGDLTRHMSQPDGASDLKGGAIVKLLPDGTYDFKDGDWRIAEKYKQKVIEAYGKQEKAESVPPVREGNAEEVGVAPDRAIFNSEHDAVVVGKRVWQAVERAKTGDNQADIGMEGVSVYGANFTRPQTERILEGYRKHVKTLPENDPDKAPLQQFVDALSQAYSRGDESGVTIAVHDETAPARTAKTIRHEGAHRKNSARRMDMDSMQDDILRHPLAAKAAEGLRKSTGAYENSARIVDEINAFIESGDHDLLGLSAEEATELNKIIDDATNVEEYYKSRLRTLNERIAKASSPQPSVASASQRVPAPEQSSTQLVPKTGGDGKHYVHLAGEGAPTLNVRVDSADQASAAMQLYRDKYGLGSSTLGEGSGAIFDPQGKQIGHVSYNGRVWEGRAQDWTRDTQLLQEAYDFGKAAPKQLAQPAASSVAPEQTTKYKYGNTQAVIPKGSPASKAMESARLRIAKSDLAGDGKDIGGNHVTVRYGIQSDDVDGIKKYLAAQAPFEAKLGETIAFPPSEHSDGAAPIVAPIEAPELHRLEKELDQHGDFIERSFPDYKPHATIAYVKPEAAKKYTGLKDTAGKTFTVDRIAISDRNGDVTEVKLEGKATPAESERVGTKPEILAPTAEANTPEGLMRSQRRSNIVVRDVRDFDGNRLGVLTQPYDGTEQGALEAAKDIEQKMYLHYPKASNIQSRIGATDQAGQPKWAISPNLKHISEVGTDAARYTWGDTSATDELPSSPNTPAWYDWLEREHGLESPKAEQDVERVGTQESVAPAGAYQPPTTANLEEYHSALAKINANPELSRAEKDYRIASLKKANPQVSSDYDNGGSMLFDGRADIDIKHAGLTADSPSVRAIAESVGAIDKQGRVNWRDSVPEQKSAFEFVSTVNEWVGRGNTLPEAVKTAIGFNEDWEPWGDVVLRHESVEVPEVAPRNQGNMVAVGKNILANGMRIASKDEPLFWPERGMDVYFDQGSWWMRNPGVRIMGSEWHRVTDPDTNNSIEYAFKNGNLANERPAPDSRTEAQKKFDKVRAKKPTKAERQHQELMAKIAEHYTPGNILWNSYWRNYSKVLEFYPNGKDGHSGWLVKEITTDKDGNPLPNEQPRLHATSPDFSRGDKVVGKVETPAVSKPESPAETGVRTIVLPVGAGAVNLPDNLKPPISAEPHQVSAQPTPPAGDRWIADRGAAPGEPEQFLDVEDDDFDSAKAAITEREIEGKGAVYDAHLADGTLVGTYGTLEEAAKAAEYAVDHPSTQATVLRDHLYDQITAGNMPKDNNALRAMVSEFDGKPADNARLKEAQEDLESAIVRRTHDIATSGMDEQTTFDKLVSLYDSQPNLNIRTSTSVQNQAYSTPAPLAWVADKLAGVGPDTTVHDNTAGNGMLMIAADPSNVRVNELNDQRVENLKAQGFTVTQGDALQQQIEPKSVDSVVVNPPFGSVKDKHGLPIKVDVDGYKIGKIDHLIASKALEAMKNDGRATIILGADKVTGGISKDDRIFFNWLYSHYNVVSHFEVDGALYGRQGANWPVRVITVAGRQQSNRISPMPGTIARVSTWKDVYEQYRKSMAAVESAAGSQRPDRSLAQSQPTQPGTVRGRTAEPIAEANPAKPEASPAGSGKLRGAQPRPVSDRSGATSEGVASSSPSVRPDADVARSDQPERGTKHGAAGERVAKSGSDQRSPAPVKTSTPTVGNEFQVPYAPASSKKDVDVLIPTNMKQPLEQAMLALQDAVGDIDTFVADELGYGSMDELHEAFMGLQVDAVAAAIHQIKSGKSVIIADQTGIGKGRQAAAIIRWTVKHGNIPVFVTKAPSLFSDMYGDLSDIGTNDVNPFIVNADENITLLDGSKVFGNKLSTHRRTLEEIRVTGQLPDDRNAVFLTYSQINKPNVQQQLLQRLAPNSVFILDESHNAGGASQTGEFMQNLLQSARGVTYLSATYAKRPDNMPVYFKTDIGMAIGDNESLITAMQEGGLPLQTVVSHNLVKAGQMFRRERSWDGISILNKVDTANRAQHTKLADAATSALRAIVAADREFHEGFVSNLKDEFKKEGESVKGGGSKASQTVNHTEFTAVVHNFVRQMLLGIKANSAADDAIAAIGRGEKPVIAVDNTMGSFLSAYSGDHNIQQGQPLEDFDYRTVLSRALDRTRKVIVTDKQGNDSVRVVRLEELNDQTRAVYDEAQSLIDKLDIDLPVSPIDWIRYRLESAGYSVAEITGRNLSVDYSDPESPKLSHVPTQEQRDKVETTRRFNDGRLDAVIINVAGSTGISMHASERFADQRPRHMIVVQPAQDINIFIQTLGRTNRTGQVEKPKYTILNADLPAEKRPTALLSKKMKSLNANTSSNTESATSIKAADMLNKYGDQVIGNYLNDNPEIERMLGVTGLSDGEPVEDIARKATGRLALAPVKVQEAFYRDVEQQYNDLIDYLNSTNQNELEPKTFDFDAKELNSIVMVQGTNPESPFGEDAVYGEYDIKMQGKPLTAKEVTEEIAKNLGSKNGWDHVNGLIDDLDRQLQDYQKGMDLTSPAFSQSNDVAVRTRSFLRGHEIGSTLRIEINGDVYSAAITNIKSTHKGHGNPYALSKVNVHLATTGPMRTISVPATQLNRIEVTPLYEKPEDIFRVVRTDLREQAKIITGNLLSAYGELRDTRGTIINFTKADGTTEQGILLPKRFSLQSGTHGDYRFATAKHAVEFLKKSTNSAVERFGISSRDQSVRVISDGNKLAIVTPKSRAKGGKYFLDKDLTDIVGDFVSVGQTMRATIPNSKEVKAIDHLMKKTALYASPSMADEAKSMAPREKPTKKSKVAAAGAEDVTGEVPGPGAKNVGHEEATDTRTASEKKFDDVMGRGGMKEYNSGLNVVGAVRQADNLDIPQGSFTVERTKKRDYNFIDRFQTPLSLLDFQGRYEKIGGLLGKEASDLIRATKHDIEGMMHGWGKELDKVFEFSERDRKARNLSRKDYDQKFIALIEKNFDDPTRKGATPDQQQALEAHDRLTEEFRNYIIRARRDLLGLADVEDALSPAGMREWAAVPPLDDVEISREVVTEEVNGRKLKRYVMHLDGDPNWSQVRRAIRQLGAFEPDINERDRTVTFYSKRGAEAFEALQNGEGTRPLGFINARREELEARLEDIKARVPDDWGITEQGYFRHLFLGDIRVFEDGHFVGVAQTYAEAQKMAIEILKENPDAQVTARAREMHAVDPTVRLTTGKYDYVVNELQKDVEITRAELLEDLRGVIGKNSGKQKFFGALLERKGAKGYSQDYRKVMELHAAQVARTQELSKLNRSLQPIIENIRKNGQPGLADALQRHLDALWGTPSKWEQDFGRLLETIPVLRNHIANPALALRATAQRLTALQSILKLRYNLRSAGVNLLDPQRTLWPYTTTKEFAALYAEYLKPETRQMLRDRGVVQGSTKLEGDSAIIGHARKDLFSRASQVNRSLGYLHGIKLAEEQGLSGEEAHRMGMEWADRVEFDNSVWNSPEILRNPAGKILGQFKGYTIKTYENLLHLLRKRGADTNADVAKRAFKWSAGQAAMGGVKSFGYLGKMLGGFLIVGALAKALQHYGMSREEANRTAEAVYYGAPAIVGVDLSASVGILEEPFGNSTAERLVNFAGGPTIGTAVTLTDKLSKAKRPSDAWGAARSLTPYAKSAEAAYGLATHGYGTVKTGTSQTRLNPFETTMLALGFTPVKQSRFYDLRDSRNKIEWIRVPSKER